MNTIIKDKEQKPLPRLIKGQSTYKLIVPEKVEEKIRYLIRKYPHTEWSGVLFYRRQGTFENNDLVLTCEDIYPMDLGSSGWTEFNMSEEVTSYIAENLDLFACETGLVHSHHSYGAFFSGQDDKMLQQEGDDTNCFLSLVVDTRGSYVARITRKLQYKSKVTIEMKETTYNFFGDGERKIESSGEPIEQTKEETVIQYFDLDVERHEVPNSLDFLDKRFEEIETRKKAETSKTFSPVPKFDTPFSDWLHKENEKDDWPTYSKKSSEEEPLLFTKEEMGEVEWCPNPDVIHDQLVRMLLCSLTISTDKIDLEQWVERHMVNIYSKVFNTRNVYGTDPFSSWCDFATEFFLENYDEESIPDEEVDIDVFYSLVAQAMIDELESLPQNRYIYAYISRLSSYLI